MSETQTCQQAWLFEMLMTTPDVAATGSLVRADLRWPHQGTQQTKPRVMPETSFVLDGTRFVSFGKLHTEAIGEWHWSMFREWLAMMTASEPSSTDGPPHPSAGEVLAWLKQALKNADRPDCLCDSPLLDFTLVTSRAGAASGKLERARLLVEMLRELSEMFLQSPRDRIYFEVLRRTYFEPSAKQRVVAETLNLSFGSYRRYLATAIQRIADALQRHELAAVQGAGA